MKSANDTPSESLSDERLTSPWLTVGQVALLNRYCRKYRQKRGPGLLFAALREMRREFDIPEEAELPAEQEPAPIAARPKKKGAAGAKQGRGAMRKVGA